MALFCPISECAVYTRPEWTNRRISDSFTVNFWVIGENIIYAQPHGKPSGADIHAAFDANDEVVSYIRERHSSYVQIEDYAFVTGVDFGTRRVFVEKMDANDALNAIVFCNLSIMLSIAVSMGRRLTSRPIEIHTVRSYRDAVKQALQVGCVSQVTSPSSPINLGGYACDKTQSLQTVNIRSDAELNLTLPDLSIQGVLVDDTVLHTRNIGYLDSRHVPAITEHRLQIDALTKHTGGIEYVVVDISGIIGTSHAARIEYMNTLRQWHQDTRFRLYVAYGADSLQKTALLLGNALMPFKVQMADSCQEAFEIICKDRQQAAFAADEPVAVHTRVASDEDLRQFLAYIGRVSWDSDERADASDVSEDHPLAALYQSVNLVKEEIGGLFEERKKIEAQLYQARKMESVGRFAAGVAHDINNILCIISGNTQLALFELDKDSQAAAFLEDAKKATGRAEDVVKQLLEFSRTQNQNHKPMEAVSVIRDALRMLRATIPASVQVKESLPDSAINISTDATQINQILMNLFANAAHSMDKNGGELEVRVSKEFILDSPIGKYSERRAGEFLQLVVSDTGAGIDSAHIDQIFDPYFTTKGVGNGSGLGLAVVAGIVKAHGGSISVRSEVGQGTTFTILFPVVNEAPVKAVEHSTTISHGTESLLLVEDEVAVATVMKKMLSRLGYCVEAMTNPFDAIQYYRANPDRFDLIITDMTMPSMTGIELARDARRVRENVPVIICTGHSPLIDAEKAEQLGISALATKPLEIQELASIVRTVLDDHSRTTAQLAKLH